MKTSNTLNIQCFHSAVHQGFVKACLEYAANTIIKGLKRANVNV